MAALDKITPTDRRIARSSAEINGKTYGFLCAIPEGGFDRTIILIHGFPDLSFGWRYQIPLFLDLGYRVVCPDCIGYGRSDAPTDSIIPYTFKSLADDFVSLAKQLGCVNTIVGGHDWGSMIAYRMAIWHPEFVTHIFTACVPYSLPNVEWVETESLTKIYPTLGYQLQFGSGLIEQATRTKEGIHKFLNAMYDGRTSDNQSAIDLNKGLDFDLAARLEKTALLSEELATLFWERARYCKNVKGPFPKKHYKKGYIISALGWFISLSHRQRNSTTQTPVPMEKHKMGDKSEKAMEKQYTEIFVYSIYNQQSNTVADAGPEK